MKESGQGEDETGQHQSYKVMKERKAHDLSTGHR